MVDGNTNPYVIKKVGGSTFCGVSYFLQYSIIFTLFLSKLSDIIYYNNQDPSMVTGGEWMKGMDLESNQVFKVLTQLDRKDPLFEHFLTIPSNAMGSLRKELFETIGMERTKSLLLRYGWHCGASDALKIKEIQWENEIETILAGSKLHKMNGYIEEVKLVINQFNFFNSTLNIEAIWKKSYEAKEHIKLFGLSKKPVCHTLVGYESGYLSTIFGEKVIAVEVECEAMGDDCCRTVARTVKEWNGEIDDEIKYYESKSLINELSDAYEQIKREKEDLMKAYHVHTKIMNEMLHESSLSSITKTLNQILDIPILIEDKDYNIRAMAGVSQEQITKKKTKELKEINKTEIIQFDQETEKLITPIFLHQNIAGYCSFLYENKIPEELDWMILERASLACSIILLNERSRLKTEQRISGSFLEEILSNQLSTEEMFKRAYYLGFDLNPPYTIIALNRLNHHGSFKEVLEFNDELINSLYTFFKNQKINAILGQKSGNTIILLSNDSLLKSHSTIEKLCDKLHDYCLFKFTKYSFKFGLSSTSNTIEDLTNLYDESLAALKIANPIRNIIFFDSLGIEGLLFQINQSDYIHKFIHKTIGNLIEEDHSKNMDLTKTLYHYLNTGCNVHKTARVINFSISGLRYRLQRINEILQIDINEPNHSYQLFLALKYLILLGELEIETRIDLD